MKLPKTSKKVLHFKFGDEWYQIVQDKDKYLLYSCGINESDYTMLATGNNPVKLEDKIYSGKLK
jgi:hypothetical protein